MKSERRQGLTENSLAKWLASFLESVTPFKNQIYWTVVGILALVCLGFLWSNVSRSGRTKAWGEYFAALESGNRESLEALAHDYTSGEVAARIRLSSGELLLMEACNEINTQKDAAREKLEKALGFFLEAQSKFRSDSLLNEQLLFGLGKTYESLAMVRTGQDDLSSAIKTYEQLVARYPQGTYTQEAEKTLKTLNSPAMSRLMSYYAAMQSAPAENTLPPQIDPTVPSLENPIQMPAELDFPEDLTTETPEIPSELILEETP
ncbi:MAG: hypothetical protein FWC43_12860 [Planctomycetaceae bacterium]|nr:hypothetical protein [Planctomycetaceae bacterium]